MKGRLFHPYNAFCHGEFDYPREVNENHEKGWWITDAGFALQEDMKDGLFTILEKPFWLALIASNLERVVLSHSEILRYLSREPNGSTLCINLGQSKCQSGLDWSLTTELKSVFCYRLGSR